MFSFIIIYGMILRDSDKEGADKLMETVEVKNEGKKQNIVIPESMHFSENDLCAAKIDDAIIIMPRRSVRQLMRYGFDHFTSDVFSEGRTELHSKSAPIV